VKVAGGPSQTDQSALTDRVWDGIMHTFRFGDYHKKTSDIDPSCMVCFPTPPAP